MLSLGMNYGNNFYISAQKTYECNINQELRFMIDTNVRPFKFFFLFLASNFTYTTLKIKGVSWIRIPANKYIISNENKTSCQIEIFARF